MDLANVTYTPIDGIAHVVLNHPAHLNAISPPLLEDVARVCDAIETDASLPISTD
jgi:enoyl-CoA hydratase/carnithine racemase